MQHLSWAWKDHRSFTSKSYLLGVSFPTQLPKIHCFLSYQQTKQTTGLLLACPNSPPCSRQSGKWPIQTTPETNGPTDQRYFPDCIQISLLLTIINDSQISFSLDKSNCPSEKVSLLSYSSHSMQEHQISKV